LIFFPTPEIMTKHTVNPLDFIGKVLKYGGVNGLSSSLKNKGLITGFDAAVDTSLPEFSSFEIEINLTDKGLE
jgi:secreted Zn-dependent insulinase-like peptidase